MYLGQNICNNYAAFKISYVDFSVGNSSGVSRALTILYTITRRLDEKKCFTIINISIH